MGIKRRDRCYTGELIVSLREVRKHLDPCSDTVAVNK